MDTDKRKPLKNYVFSGAGFGTDTGSFGSGGGGADRSHRRAFQGTAFEKLLVRYLERMPLGMPYPKIVERVRESVQSEELRGDCSLAVDATGVGAPVMDMLRAARLGCDLTAVVITGEIGARARTRYRSGT